MSNNDLLTSLISDIKTYSAKDPLLPWLRGIRKMNDSLPPRTLKEKFPRFLQKCAQTFESDRRYRNDLRYIRVWLKLMDFVDDPRALLRTMEANQIGTKHSLFYQAYALYYEKNKKFEEAEKMYHLGVQNLAEPIGALEKSDEQFLQRMERHRRHRRRRNQEKRTTKRPLSDRTIPPNGERSKENACRIGARPIESQHDPSRSKHQVTSGRGSEELKMFSGDDTVVVKFVDTAIVGKSEAEDACHHGLVDPTINMKDAMSTINDMFREPIVTAPISRRSCQSQRKNNNVDSGFQVFVDDDLDNGGKSENNKEELSRIATHQSHRGPLNIFIDDDNDSPDQSGVQNPTDDSTSPASHRNVFVFPKPKDLPGESSSDLDVGGSSRPRRN
ncbi:hypothetical protein ACFX19_001596 [Malus domestica]